MMIQQYIGGKLVDGLGKPLNVLNPATEDVIDTVGCATAQQAKEALAAAEKAYKTWSKTSLNERVGWMLKLRDACLAKRDTFVKLISDESGRTYSLACADFDWCMISFQYYSDEMKRVYGLTIPNPAGVPGSAYHIVERRPIGVTVAHLAWNYPMGNAGIKIAPAVVSGCACIVKPSSETPLSLLYLGKVAAEIGFPAGVLNIISGPSGEVAKTLNESTIPKMITLIGSSETGLQIMREAATSVKKYSLELGGNAPVIVMDDVNLETVAANIVAKKTGFAGQTCVNYNRIYVQEKIYPAFCEAVRKELQKVKLGKWDDAGYVMGPMINRKARDRMFGFIEDAVHSGAKLVMGGEIPAGLEKGSYLTPALLVDVNDDMRVSREEIFGPIIPLQPFKTLDEAIEKANHTIYGLSGYFFGHRAQEISQAFEGMEAGEIFVNGSAGTEQTPHAGVKQSGVGCDKSHWSLEEYLDFKYLSIVP
ncbi:MAG: aldehyde dehydrogenase family protein [Eubacteriales bacterium]|nr:aldehyde dehydrogenase family protein [Eubacteriales bacterium]